MKAVLLVLSSISDRPSNIAGTAFITFLIERFNQRARCLIPLGFYYPYKMRPIMTGRNK